MGGLSEVTLSHTMPGPWNNWWHTIATLKGNWLHGDDRGWRSRHHREHVEGDYRNPPPEGKYQQLARRSWRLLKKPPVQLMWEARVALCELYFDALRAYGAEVIDIAIGSKHAHVLVRFRPLQNPATPAPQSPATPVAGFCEAHHFGDDDPRDPLPRYILGKTHSWCSREMKKLFAPPQSQSPPSPEGGPRHRSGGALHDWALTPGGLFAPRPKCVPVADRAHQIKIANYIRDHIEEGAAVHSLLIRE